jgi:quercetin dioxygenase-like cupin family protein
MQTVKVTREEQFSDRQLYRESPLKTDKIAFNIYDFEPWQALPMHRHPGSDTILMAVQGSGTMFMRDSEFALDESEAVYVPAGDPFGILAGENDMIVLAVQGPTPLETQDVPGLAYRCPACDLESPLATGVADRKETTCPRCNARLRLARAGDMYQAEEVGEPAFIEAPAEEAGRRAKMPGEPGAGETAGTAPGRETAGGDNGAGETETPAKIAFSVYEFQPWQVLPMHRNPGNDTLLYMAMGEGIMLVGDEAQSVDDNTVVYIPAGATYGMIAADNEVVAVSMQCPTPVEAEVFGNLGYNCPICDLGTPVTTNTYDGCITVCPRCNIKLKLTREEDGFRAEETAEPAPAEAETI